MIQEVQTYMQGAWASERLLSTKGPSRAPRVQQGVPQNLPGTILERHARACFRGLPESVKDGQLGRFY